MIPRNLRGLSGPSKDETRVSVGFPDKIREAALRRRAATAYLRLSGTCEAQAAALGGRRHTAMVARRKGEGPFARTLLEIDALERAGIDTFELFVAMMETRIEARGGAEAMCPRELAYEEDELDRQEDEAQLAYLTGHGSVQEWRDALGRYIARGKLVWHALGKVAA